MKSSRNTTLNATTQSEAARWVIRLSAENVSPSERASFQTWLASSDTNRRAFESAQRAWSTLDLAAGAVEAGHELLSDRLDGEIAVADRIIAAQLPGPLRALRRRLIWGAAAGLAAGILITLTMIQLARVESPSSAVTVEVHETGIGERRHVALADGSVITLNADTEVVTYLTADIRSVTMIYGEAYFEVAKDAERPFEVTVGSGKVTAAGTAFNIYHRNNETRVTVLEGEVEVEAALQKLLAGSGLSYLYTEEDAIAIVKDEGAATPEETTAPEVEGPSEFTDEIVVTASRRQENVREIPSTVNVTEGADLEAKGAGSIDEIARDVVGINIVDSAPQRDAITLRGVAINISTNLSQAPVGVFFNEIPLTDYFAYFGNFDVIPFDLERVEFLKGPQGTLYGSASLGGAIRYISKKPNLNENEGALHLTVGSTADGGINYLTQGMFNTVLADGKFALRGVVSYQDDGGWIDRITMKAVSPATDFSFDFHDLDLRRVTE